MKIIFTYIFALFFLFSISFSMAAHLAEQINTLSSQRAFVDKFVESIAVQIRIIDEQIAFAPSNALQSDILKLHLEREQLRLRKLQLQKAWQTTIKKQEETIAQIKYQLEKGLLEEQQPSKVEPKKRLIARVREQVAQKPLSVEDSMDQAETSSSKPFSHVRSQTPLKLVSRLPFNEERNSSPSVSEGLSSTTTTPSHSGSVRPKSILKTKKNYSRKVSFAPIKEVRKYLNGDPALYPKNILEVFDPSRFYLKPLAVPYQLHTKVN